MKGHCLDIGLPPERGRRHYFDCFEFAIGGLLGWQLGRAAYVRDLYSLFDAVCLVEQPGEDLLVLYSRAVDVSAHLVRAFGYALEGVACPAGMGGEGGGEGRCVVDFDEYYFPGYNNHGRQSFRHAALCIGAGPAGSVRVLNPVLQFSGDHNCEEALLCIPPEARASTVFHVLVRDGDPELKGDGTDANRLRDWALQNLERWQGERVRVQDGIVHYGLGAYGLLLERVRDGSALQPAVSHFYRWIYPWMLKRDYLRRTASAVASRMVEVLEELVRVLEIVETQLLRLAAGRERLRIPTTLRLQTVTSLIGQYLELEEERTRGVA